MFTLKRRRYNLGGAGGGGGDVNLHLSNSELYCKYILCQTVLWGRGGGRIFHISRITHSCNESKHCVGRSGGGWIASRDGLSLSQNIMTVYSNYINYKPGCIGRLRD